MLIEMLGEYFGLVRFREFSKCVLCAPEVRYLEVHDVLGLKHGGSLSSIEDLQKLQLTFGCARVCTASRPDEFARVILVDGWTLKLTLACARQIDEVGGLRDYGAWKKGGTGGGKTHFVVYMKRGADRAREDAHGRA